MNIITEGTIESYARRDCVRGNHCPVINEPRKNLMTLVMRGFKLKPKTIRNRPY